MRATGALPSLKGLLNLLKLTQHSRAGLTLCRPAGFVRLGLANVNRQTVNRKTMPLVDSQPGGSHSRSPGRKSWVGAINEPSPFGDDIQPNISPQLDSTPASLRPYSVPSLPWVRISTVPKRVPDPLGSMETKCSSSPVPVFSSQPSPCVPLQLSFWSSSPPCFPM